MNLGGPLQAGLMCRNGFVLALARIEELKAEITTACESFAYEYVISIGSPETTGMDEGPTQEEVMAGLNPTEQTKIIDLVRQIRESGVSVFIIEHSMRVIMGLCDRICVIHHGQVIAVGTPGQICADQNVINSYLGEGNAFAKA